MIYLPTIISILEVLIVTVPVLFIVAFVTVAERKTMASMQRRVGPNIVGFYGLLQAFADALKLLLKEYVSPTQANLILFFLGPIIFSVFLLLGYAVLPFASAIPLIPYTILYIVLMIIYLRFLICRNSYVQHNYGTSLNISDVLTIFYYNYEAIIKRIIENFIYFFSFFRILLGLLGYIEALGGVFMPDLDFYFLTKDMEQGTVQRTPLLQAGETLANKGEGTYPVTGGWVETGFIGSGKVPRVIGVVVDGARAGFDYQYTAGNQPYNRNFACVLYELRAAGYKTGSYTCLDYNVSMSAGQAGVNMGFINSYRKTIGLNDTPFGGFNISDKLINGIAE